MPELPEVETITRLLRDGTGIYNTSIIGCQITGAQLLWERTLAAPSPNQFIEQVIGQTIQSLSRRGKFLVFSLTEFTLLIHLRMSGDMRVESLQDDLGKPKPFEKHDRLGLEFNNGQRMVFNDTRKFGRVWLLKDPAQVLGDLGPEPLENTITPEAFFEMLHTRRSQLKTLLMDQHFLAGLGNIYTDEALHLARLHPLASSDQVTPKESARLLAAIREVLSEGIRRNGASIDWVYRGGDFQNHFRVYGRGGEPCPNCGTPIKRMVVGQRGTHICPNCQRLD
jgi:formamidopyrimidine-DNA glycosylase